MEAGEVVETGETEQILNHRRDPRTKDFVTRRAEEVVPGDSDR